MLKSIFFGSEISEYRFILLLFCVCSAKCMITETQHERMFLAQTQVIFRQFLVNNN